MGPRSENADHIITRLRDYMHSTCFNGAAFRERGSPSYARPRRRAEDSFNGAAFRERGSPVCQLVATSEHTASMGPRSENADHPACGSPECPRAESFNGAAFRERGSPERVDDRLHMALESFNGAAFRERGSRTSVARALRAPDLASMGPRSENADHASSMSIMRRLHLQLLQWGRVQRTRITPRVGSTRGM